MILKGYTPEMAMQLAIVETPYILSGTTLTGQTSRDFIFDQVTATNSDNNFKLQTVPTQLPDGPVPVTFATITPTVCSIDVVGNVSRIIDGTGTVTATSAGCTQGFTRSMLRSASGAGYTQTGLAAGSLAAHIKANIDTMLSGKTAGNAVQMMWNTGESYSTTTPVGTRNGTLFTGALNVAWRSFCRTGVSIGYFQVSLISDRHFIYARHVGCSVGDTIVWMDNTGAFISRTVSAVTDIGTSNDISIGCLSVAVPASLVPVQLLPTTWATKLPTLAIAGTYGYFKVPNISILYDDATGRIKMHVQKSGRRVDTGWTESLPDDGTFGVAGDYALWSSIVQGGDSSSPIFVPINDGTGLKPVLLTSHYAASGGESYGDWITTINSVMTTQAGSAYAVTSPSFTGFTSY